MSDEVGDVEIGSESLLLRVVEILPPLNLDPHALQGLDGLVVPHPGVRAVGVARDEVEVSAEIGEIVLALLQQGLGDMSDHTFAMPHYLVVGSPCDLHLRMPELGEVPARTGLLGSERRGHSVQSLKGGHRSLGIELP